MVHRPALRASAILGVLACGGCATTVEPRAGAASPASLATPDVADGRAAARIPPFRARDTDSPPPVLQFARLTTELAPGTKVGRRLEGGLCAPRANLLVSEAFAGAISNEAGEAFRSEATAQGFRLLHVEASAFGESQPPADPDLRIGGVVEGFESKLCASSAGRKGRVSVRVKWEAFSPREQRVVFTKVTPGVFESQAFVEATPRDIDVAALSSSLHALFVDPDFEAFLRRLTADTGSTETIASEPSLPPLHLTTVQVFSGSTQSNAPRLKDAVVTVMTDTVSGSRLLHRPRLSGHQPPRGRLPSIRQGQALERSGRSSGRWFAGTRPATWRW